MSYMSRILELIECARQATASRRTARSPWFADEAIEGLASFVIDNGMHLPVRYELQWLNASYCPGSAGIRVVRECYCLKALVSAEEMV